MWHCASLCLILIIAVWMMSYGLMRHDFNENKIQVNIIRKDTVRINESVKEVGNNKNNKIKHHIPKFMLELYERSKGFKKNNSAPDVVRSVVPTHAETIYPDFLNEELNNDHHMLIFKVPKTNSDELFLEAQLRILTVVQIPSSSLLGIERVLKISFYNESTRTLTTIEEKHIYQNDNSWVSFNVSTVVRSLLNKSVVINSKLTLKLILTIKSFVPVVENKLGVFKLSLMPLEENYEHDYPVLLLYYKVDGRKVVEDRKMEYEVVRSKRNVEEDYEEETNRVWDENGVSKPINKKLKRIRNACRKRPLYVDFAEISYDTWIVQPDGYEAYQCLGKCFYPVAEHLSPTKHAIVQALLHSVSPSRAPRSCCVPTKLDSISILYIDEQGVLTYRYGYKDMVVTECGCR